MNIPSIETPTILNIYSWIILKYMDVADSFFTMQASILVIMAISRGNLCG